MSEIKNEMINELKSRHLWYTIVWEQLKRGDQNFLPFPRRVRAKDIPAFNEWKNEIMFPILKRLNVISDDLKIIGEEVNFSITTNNPRKRWELALDLLRQMRVNLPELDTHPKGHRPHMTALGTYFVTADVAKQIKDEYDALYERWEEICHSPENRGDIMVDTILSVNFYDEAGSKNDNEKNEKNDKNDENDENDKK